ncbi:MAG TPA: AGE family epimerase/isomerase [Angustibacter sp.]|nr:AGE family epimerase/isomerase [Angustibacter sp.]
MRAFLDAEAQRLLGFAAGAADPRGGFGWLDDDGRVDASRPLHLWVNARMTHVFGLGALLDVPGAGELCDRGLQALTGPLHDGEHGGWWSAVDTDGSPAQTRKSAYDHAFVLLAATTAVQAARPGAQTLLRHAIEVIEEHFWDDDAGALVDTWDAAWTTAEPYRGANANMHGVEAFLAAADATGDGVWLTRATRVADRIVGREARAAGWRVPEHYTADWTPQPDYARDTPSDPFRPFGATIGHGLEWSRLLVHLDAALALHATDDPVAETAEDAAEPWLVPAARSLFDTAVAEGWSADGSPGFVYTVDWDGVPVVRQRMHWVVAEAVAAAAVLYQVTGEGLYRELYDTWWAYAREHLVDDQRGSWWHELGPDQQPARTVWSGKPDVYHALQATLLPRMPLAPTLAAALAARRR